jgi:hypothetical protein
MVQFQERRSALLKNEVSKLLQRPPTPNAKRRRRAQKNASDRRVRRGEYFLRGLLVTPAMRARMAKLGHILDREVDDREVVERTLIERGAAGTRTEPPNRFPTASDARHSRPCRPGWTRDWLAA